MKICSQKIELKLEIQNLLFGVSDSVIWAKKNLDPNLQIHVK